MRVLRVFWWFLPRGLGVGLSVELGLRYRLLWFGSSSGLGGVCMVRKWKWYMLTANVIRVPYMNPITLGL